MIKQLRNRFGKLPLEILYQGYPRIAEVIQQVLLFNSDNTVRKRVLYFIRTSGRLFKYNKKGELKRKLSNYVTDYSLILINRECDKVRLKAFDKKAKQFNINYIICKGIDCTSPGFNFTPYKDKIAETYHNQNQILKGGIGCFLGHAEAWKIFDADKKSDVALICEDDARILGPLPASQKDFEIPEDADLIFVNQRMGEGLLNDKYTKHFQNHSYIKVPLITAISELLKITNPISGPGGDGYILTRKGVEKLLRIYSKCRIDVDVDWFLFCHSLKDSEIIDFIALDSTGRFNSMNMSEERLCSYVLLPILVEQSPGESSRNPEDTNSYIIKSHI